jgi:hypothetical protein
MRQQIYEDLQDAYTDLGTLRDDAIDTFEVEEQQWIGGSRINKGDLWELYMRRDVRRARARY